MLSRGNTNSSPPRLNTDQKTRLEKKQHQHRDEALRKRLEKRLSDRNKTQLERQEKDFKELKQQIEKAKLTDTINSLAQNSNDTISLSQEKTLEKELDTDKLELDTDELELDEDIILDLDNNHLDLSQNNPYSQEAGDGNFHLDTYLDDTAKQSSNNNSNSASNHNTSSSQTIHEASNSTNSQHNNNHNSTDTNYSTENSYNTNNTHNRYNSANGSVNTAGTNPDGAVSDNTTPAHITDSIRNPENHSTTTPSNTLSHNNPNLTEPNNHISCVESPDPNGMPDNDMLQNLMKQFGGGNMGDMGNMLSDSSPDPIWNTNQEYLNNFDDEPQFPEQKKTNNYRSQPYGQDVVQDAVNLAEDSQHFHQSSFAQPFMEGLGQYEKGYDTYGSDQHGLHYLRGNDLFTLAPPNLPNAFDINANNRGGQPAFDMNSAGNSGSGQNSFDMGQGSNNFNPHSPNPDTDPNNYQTIGADGSSNFQPEEITPAHANTSLFAGAHNIASLPESPQESKEEQGQAISIITILLVLTVIGLIGYIGYLLYV